MAAYAAKARVKPLVLVPQGKIAAGKLAQAIVHGAQVIMVRGNFDDCLRLSRGLAENYPVALVNSVNPMRLEGQKTASFEIVDLLGDAPDVHVLPVGNAGNISAYWKGYVEYAEGRRVDAHSADARLAGRRGRTPGHRVARARPRDRGLGHPHRQPGLVAPCGCRRRRVRRQVQVGERRADPVRPAPAGSKRWGLRRARVRHRGGGAAPGRRRRPVVRRGGPSSSPSPGTA